MVYKNSQGISYDISSVKKIESDVEIIKEDTDSVTIKKNNDGDFRVPMFTDTHLGRRHILFRKNIQSSIKS